MAGTDTNMAPCASMDAMKIGSDDDGSNDPTCIHESNCLSSCVKYIKSM